MPTASPRKSRWLVGLIVSGLAYLLVSRSLDVTAEQSAIEASEQALRAIDATAAGPAPAGPG